MRGKLITSLAALCVGLAPLASGGTEPSPVAGVPGALVGQHGPTVDWTDNLEVVAHSSLLMPNKSFRPLGNHGAPALIGDCAYVGRWHDYSGTYGVQIVDLAGNSAELPVVGDVPASKNNGVAREIRAIDLPGFRLLVVMTFEQALGGRANNKLLFIRVDDADCTKTTLAGTYDMRTLRGHEFFLWLDPDPAHDVDGHPRILVYVTTPVSPAFFVVNATDPANPLLVGGYDAGIPVASANEIAGTGLGKYAHSISLSPDGTEAYLSYWDGGFFTVDTTAFALGVPGTAVPKGAMSVPYTYPLDEFGNTHSAVKVPGTDTAVVGDEIYVSTDGCPFGWMRLIDVGSPTRAPTQIGEFRLAENRPENCTSLDDGAVDALDSQLVELPDGRRIDGTFSMHNQTVLGRYVFTSWYGGGMRVVDVADPTNPAEVGAFVPKPIEGNLVSNPNTTAPTWGQTATASDDWRVQTWSYPLIRDGLIYVTDTRNGLYVLRPAPGSPFAADVAATRFIEGNSNVGEWLVARGS